MPLLDLPDELLLLIIESLDNEKDILSFLVTHSQVYGIQQMGPLYAYNIKFSGSSSLLWYAEKGYESAVETLLEKGADLECKAGDWETPLILAALYGHRHIAKLLIEKGCDLESKDRQGRTALRHAFNAEHQDIVMLLLEKGCDISCEGSWTAIGTAAENGYEGVVRLLREELI
ncbi:ankyrin repeat-containing domain protein [Aspergillus transmontanensis]|uniref:Ankyrin repeat-containing domain protein n=1 Tax=Aspergillus transmontanensis TaxID=1034304 RepID=A0A5N6W7E0_9EURO|nr:ankyrin repeat-containing domain protein [Aspergillus transmontanensis]